MLAKLKFSERLVTSRRSLNQTPKAANFIKITDTRSAQWTNRGSLPFFEEFLIGFLQVSQHANSKVAQIPCLWHGPPCLDFGFRWKSFSTRCPLLLRLRWLPGSNIEQVCGVRPMSFEDQRPQPDANWIPTPQRDAATLGPKRIWFSISPCFYASLRGGWKKKPLNTLEIEETSVNRPASPVHFDRASAAPQEKPSPSHCTLWLSSCRPQGVPVHQLLFVCW